MYKDIYMTMVPSPPPLFFLLILILTMNLFRHFAYTVQKKPQQKT